MGRLMCEPFQRSRKVVSAVSGAYSTIQRRNTRLRPAVFAQACSAVGHNQRGSDEFQ